MYKAFFFVLVKDNTTFMAFISQLNDMDTESENHYSSLIHPFEVSEFQY